MNRQELVQYIDTKPALKELITLEPEMLEAFFEAAHYTPRPSTNRWHAYEMMKRRCDHLVGWNARNEQLATEYHWLNFIDFLDRVLPESDEYYGLLSDENAQVLESEV